MMTRPRTGTPKTLAGSKTLARSWSVIWLRTAGRAGRRRCGSRRPAAGVDAGLDDDGLVVTRDDGAGIGEGVEVVGAVRAPRGSSLAMTGSGAATMPSRSMMPPTRATAPAKPAEAWRRRGRKGSPSGRRSVESFAAAVRPARGRWRGGGACRGRRGP